MIIPSLSRKIMIFYSKPRNLFLRTIGLIMLIPMYVNIKNRLESLEKRHNETTILLGKLDLTIEMLKRNK